MTERDVAGLVERLRAYSEASDVVLVCEEAAAALTALQQEREQIEARVWEEAVTVAQAEVEKQRARCDAAKSDEHFTVANAQRYTAQAIAEALRSRASAARTMTPAGAHRDE